MEDEIPKTTSPPRKIEAPVVDNPTLHMMAQNLTANKTDRTLRQRSDEVSAQGIEHNLESALEEESYRPPAPVTLSTSRMSSMAPSVSPSVGNIEQEWGKSTAAAAAADSYDLESKPSIVIPAPPIVASRSQMTEQQQQPPEQPQAIPENALSFNSDKHLTRPPGTPRRQSSSTARGGPFSSWFSATTRKDSKLDETKEVELSERSVEKNTTAVDESTEPETAYNLMNENDEIPTKIPAAAGIFSLFKKKMAASASAERAIDPTKPAEAVATPVKGQNNNADQIPTKVESYSGISGMWRYFVGTMCTGWVLYGLLFTAMATGLAYGALNDGNFLDFVDWDQDLNIAFIGNSYLFVNDIPRLMESISGGHVEQNSVLHTGGSLGALLVTGNGMYKRWQTQEAIMLSGYSSQYGYNSLYDYGMCTVPQLLVGSDDNITYGNQNGAYFNDGQNPCISDEKYMTYATNYLNQTSPDFDYVVLVDQTKRMAVETARQDTVSALQVYAQLIEQSGAVPVIVDTHSFFSEDTNMTGLGDIPTFQKLIEEGVDEYVSTLSSLLPRRQSPIVCPIGVAYLTIYDEKPDIWSNLFLTDAVHASLHGSYLFATVLYTSIFGHLPPEDASLPEPMDSLFTDLRKVFYGAAQYPSYDDVQYYRNVAKRVAVHKYKPKSLR